MSVGGRNGGDVVNSHRNWGKEASPPRKVLLRGSSRPTVLCARKGISRKIFPKLVQVAAHAENGNAGMAYWRITWGSRRPKPTGWVLRVPPS